MSLMRSVFFFTCSIFYNVPDLYVPKRRESRNKNSFWPFSGNSQEQMRINTDCLNDGSGYLVSSEFE